MQLGIISTALNQGNFAKCFEQSAEIGAEGIELSYSTEKNADLLYQQNHPRNLVELAKASGVAICSLNLSILCEKPSLIGNQEAISAAKEIILQAIAVAEEASVKIVNVPFFGKNTIETEKDLLQAADALGELGEHAEAAHVIIALESTLNFNQQQFLLDHVGNSESVRVYLDTGNARARKLDLPTGIRDLGAKAIAQVHFKDVRIVETQPPDYNVALGEGDVDFSAAAQALNAVGYDGWIILETPPGDNPVDAGKNNLAFAKEVLAALQ